MNMQNAFRHKEIVLNIAHVGSGGNTNDGKYFYSFEPANVMLYKGQSPAILPYTLHAEAAARFSIFRVIKSDPLSQIFDIDPATGQSVNLYNSNTMESLILLSFLVVDTELTTDEGKKVVVICDPQVGNVPEVEPD